MNIKFPYTGSFTSKKSGYTWNYTVHEDGSVDYMERSETAPIVRRSQSDRRVNVVCGGGRYVTKLANPTQECFDAIFNATGLRTNGFTWIRDDDDALQNAMLERIPLDGSYRKMKRTNLIVRVRKSSRQVYEHIPTKRLYYIDNGWCGTFKEYCYNVKTGERGERF